MAENIQAIGLIEIPQAFDFNLVRLAEEGLPLESVVELREHGFSFTEIGDIVIAPRTLKHRRIRKERLSATESERLMRVIRISNMATNIFKNKEKAFRWLRKPDDQLENRTPLHLLHTESGGRLVENMLLQIDEGIFS